MTDLTLAIRLTADGKDLVGAVAVSRQALDELGKSVERADKKAAEAGRGVDGLARGVAGLRSAALQFASIAGAGFGLAAFVRHVAEAEKANNRLVGVWRATGGVAGIARAEVDELAQSLARSTRFDVGSLKSGMATLATFRNVTGETFRETSRLAVDLAELTGGDLAGAFIALARAVEDPADGLERLRREGLKLTDAEKQQIVELANSGRLYEAQARLLDAVRGRVGGLAKDLNSGLNGGFAGVSKAFGDVAESLSRVDIVMQPILATLRAMKASLEEIQHASEEFKRKNDRSAGLGGRRAPDFAGRVLSAPSDLIGAVLVDPVARLYKELIGEPFERGVRGALGLGPTRAQQTRSDSLRRERAAFDQARGEDFGQGQPPELALREDVKKQLEIVETQARGAIAAGRAAARGPRAVAEAQLATRLDVLLRQSDLPLRDGNPESPTARIRAAGAAQLRGGFLQAANEQVRALDLESAAAERLARAQEAGEDAVRRAIVQNQIQAAVAGQAAPNIEAVAAAIERKAKADRDAELAAGLRELTKQVAGERALADARKIGLAAAERANVATALGARFTEEEIARNGALVEAYRRQLELRSELNVAEEGRKAREAVNSRAEAQRRLNVELQTTRDLLAAGELTADEGLRRNRDAERKFLDGSREFSDGARRALMDYEDDARDAARNAERFVTGSLANMEEATVRFARTGKFNFADFAAAVEADLIRLTIRAQVTGPLAQALSGLNFSSLFGSGPTPPPGGFNASTGMFGHAHTGGVVGRDAFALGAAPPDVFSGAARLHGGGVPGLKPGEVPIIAQCGEGVFTPRQMDNADRLFAALAQRGDSGVTVNVIDRRGGDGAPVETSSRQGPDGRTIIDVMVRDSFERQARQGGFDRTMRDNFGAPRAPAMR